MPITYIALFFTVVSLVTTAYFIMGGIPLLILAHDTPLDGRFIGRFFEIYYSAALVGSVGAGLSFALAGRIAFAMGSGLIAGAVLLLRRFIIRAMKRLGEAIQAHDPGAISGFRKVHAIALLFSLVQLIVIVWGILQVSSWN